MNTNNTDRGFCIIGCGRVGINLAVFLTQQGYGPAALASRTLSSAQNAAAVVPGGMVFENPVEAAKDRGVVFITTPDDRIGKVCDQVAEGGGFDEHCVVFHLSGVLSSDILSSARQNGAATGSIHPLQAFAPYESHAASPFEGINISIEGTARARVLGQKLVTALNARPFTIPTDAKTLYHASAVVASNYLVTLEHMALTLLGRAGLAPDQAFDILEPLIQGTLRNIASRGSVDALTGPVVRGDETVIARHLSEIDKKMPEFSALYRLLGQHTLEIARKRSDFPKTAEPGLTGLFSKKGM
ncbi:MAG: Rossmann-like and DUF2520 domain-containing protein [Desulfotignum sp.]|nr:Rossmann-like and DUF2520 domain-containing protein [Desulfotignum sp.]